LPERNCDSFGIFWGLLHFTNYHAADRAGRVIRSILVPVAPGRQCSHLSRAAWLARRSGAEIILLRVMPHSEQSAEDDLESAQLIATMDAPDISVRSLIIDGDPPREILNVARREKVDLIVMGVDKKWHIGSSEERAFQHFLLKSTVTGVVQQTPCPVWLDKSSTSGSMSMSCIVCFLDFKINCEGLIKFAARIAEEYETRMLLFHSTISTRMFAPGKHPNAVQGQRNLIETAEREIDRLQTRCSTSATKVVAVGNGVESLRNTLKEFSSPLVVIERVSDRWGDNNKIYEIIRYCETSVLIRVEAKNDYVSVPSKRKSVDPFILLLASMAIGISLIYLTMYLAQHTDKCHFADIRCQAPSDLLFPSAR
jgi:nucleotide-binding universal stress UspA family protein